MRFGFDGMRTLSHLPWKYFAVTPAVVYIILISALSSADIHGTVESPSVLLVLNGIFLTLAPLVASYLAAKGYLTSGSPAILLLGCGLLTLGTTSITAGWILKSSAIGANANITIHNTGCLVASLFHLAGSLIGLSGAQSFKVAPEKGRLHIAVLYCAVPSLIVSLAFLTLKGLTPVFYVHGIGPTLLRQMILSLSVTFFLASSLIFMLNHFRTGGAFVYWYSLSLLLIAEGLGILLFEKTLGSPVTWAGRGFQYLGGIYFLIACTKGFQEVRTSGLSMEKAIPTLVDISELRKAEEALRASEERFRTLAGAAFEGIAVTKNGHYVDGNEQLAKLFGYELSELIGLEVSSTIAPEDRDRVLAKIKDGEDSNIEHEILCKDGSRRTVEAQGRMLEYQGEPVRFTVIRDITERKRAEETLRQREEEFRVLVENAPDVISLFDRNLRRIYVNSEVRDNTGQDASFMMGKSLSDAGYPDSFAQPLNAALQSVFATGREETVELDYEAPKGSIWLQIRCTPLRIADGSVERVMTIGRDITERRRVEEELRKSRDELEFRVQERTTELRVSNKALMDYAAKLERLNQELEEFAFIASHDLQEPLRKIQTFASILMQSHGESLDQKAMAQISRICKSAKRMSDLVYSLLDYSRITTEPPHCESVDLAITIGDVVNEWAPSITQAGGAIEIGDLPKVSADKTEIRQLFSHLIGHAVKFRKESEPPMVKIHGQTNGGFCSIVIEDNGIGFDEQYLDKIFKPFQQLHSRGKFEGTGMGLALCRKIVERHEGSITARSTPGRGSTFIVRLPLTHTIARD